MKKIFTLITLALMVFVSGCATTDYEQYAKSAEAASVARSEALTAIAASGDSSAKVAAVMALALGAGQAQMQAPQANAALQWAQVLVPGLTQMVGMRYQYLGTKAASDTAARVAESTNNTMLGIANQIQAAPTITTTTDRHDVVTPAPVVVNTPAIVNPPVINQPVVVTPVVQVVPVFVP